MPRLLCLDELPTLRAARRNNASGGAYTAACRRLGLESLQGADPDALRRLKAFVESRAQPITITGATYELFRPE